METSKKVAFYCRVSTETQAERNTIEIQLKYSKKYVELNKLDVFDYYVDNGVSGTIPFENRPEGSRLFEDAAAGKLEVVYFYKIDRLGRTLGVIISAAQKFKELGVAIRSMTENYDTTTASGELLFNMLATIAGFEKTTICERTYGGLVNAATKGNWLGGIRPFGYKKIGKTLVVNEDKLETHDNITEAEVVRMIFDMVANKKYSACKTATYLNNLKIPSRFTFDGSKNNANGVPVNLSSAKLWQLSKISRIIKNTLYKGEHWFFRRSKKTKPVLRFFPAIVSEEIWNRAQETLDYNKKSAPKNRVYNYLLRGLVECGNCGFAMHGSTVNKHVNPIAYYTCGSNAFYKQMGREKCKNLNVVGDWLESVVLTECLKIVKNPELLVGDGSDKSEVRKTKLKEITGNIEKLQKSLSATEKEKTSTIGLCTKGLITEDDLTKRFEELKTEADVIKAKLEKLLKDKKKIKSTNICLKGATNEVAKLQEHLNEKNLSWDLKRKIVETLVEKIKVFTKYEDSRDKPITNVEIFFKFSDSFFQRNSISSAQTCVLAISLTNNLQAILSL